MKYQPTIGLEIHAELKTATKMFCNSKNNPDEKRPNVNICPVCTGHPGTLPVINQEAVRQVQRVGLALGGEVQKQSRFDRKNYFYPDLPKGYQISQYQHPLVLGGALNGVRITRVHIEEDTARSIHEQYARNIHFGSSDAKSERPASLVDFNRSGVPLMELVTEPDITSTTSLPAGRQARAFAEELQLILQYIGASDANMEQGQMRCEANVSIRPNNERMKTNEERIVLKDESYRLMGLLFEVHNKLGSVYKEKNYQDAIEEIFKREGVSYQREKKISLKFNEKAISDFFVDFLVDEKIILEVKATKFITQEDVRQVLRYIKEADVPLGIIANFRRSELEYKRIINPSFDNNSVTFGNHSSATSLGTKVEIKNLNSFRAVERAIEYEIKRQSELLERGENVVQETRGWDENKGITFSQRTKESAHDYRYFPEPDLPPLEFSDAYIEELRATIPELPAEKRKRLTEEYSIPEGLTETLVRERELGVFWEHTVSELKEWLPEKAKEIEAIKLAANYFTSDLLGLLKEQKLAEHGILVEPENFAELVKMIIEGEISSRGAKDILRYMVERGGDPSAIVESQGLRQVSDAAELEEIIKKVLHKSPAAISDYRNGKQNALQFLVGQVMKETKGAANPAVIREILTKQL